MKQKQKIEREKVIIDEESFDIYDFTGHGPWEIDGETYKFIEDYPSRTSDGEDHNIIMKRDSDGKLFKIFWWWHPSSGDYIFEDHFLEEVFEKIKITYE